MARSAGKENYQLLVLATTIISIRLGFLVLAEGGPEVAVEAEVVVGLEGVLILRTLVPQVLFPTLSAFSVKGRVME